MPVWPILIPGLCNHPCGSNRYGERASGSGRLRILVTGSPISFEEVRPDIVEVDKAYWRLSAKLSLSADAKGRIVGHAKACGYRTRAAYRTSVDVSDFVVRGAQRSGVARCLCSHYCLRMANVRFCVQKSRGATGQFQPPSFIVCARSGGSAIPPYCSGAWATPSDQVT